MPYCYPTVNSALEPLLGSRDGICKYLGYSLLFGIHHDFLAHEHASELLSPTVDNRLYVIQLCQEILRLDLLRLDLLFADVRDIQLSFRPWAR